jgi:hypothetical protein
MGVWLLVLVCFAQNTLFGAWLASVKEGFWLTRFTSPMVMNFLWRVLPLRIARPSGPTFKAVSSSLTGFPYYTTMRGQAFNQHL